MKTIYKFSLIAIAPIMLTACGGFGDDDFDTELSDVQYTSGDVNTDKYIAIGDSLTAGYADSALYIDGQINSFPNIIAKSLMQVDMATEFVQPLMNDNLGGLTSSNSGVLAALAAEDLTDTRLVLTGDLAPVNQNLITPTAVSTTSIDTPLPSVEYHNLGIPGFKLIDLDDVFGGLNPYFGRFISAGQTVNSTVAASAPTLVTVWVGNNDILGYGTDGGTGDESSATPVSGDITAPSLFDTEFDAMINSLLGASPDVQGVLINLPKITSIPFFTTVPYNAIPLTAEEAAGANAAFEDYNLALQGAVAGAFSGFGITMDNDELAQRTINFVEGLNPILILDESLTDLTGVNSDLLNFRQATANDFILLPVSSKLGTLRDSNDPLSVIGVGSPLLDDEVLTETEAGFVETARLAYNQTIQDAVTANPDNFVFLDAASELEQVASDSGYDFGQGVIFDSYVTGGAFSLDGVHPTAKGYAVVANLVIDALNSNFNANIPRANPAEYPEIYFAFPDGYDFSQ